MEGEESVAAQVERFEAYCLRKQSLEGEIELVLAMRDDNAVEAVQLAEHELGRTKRECAEIEARVEKARRLEFDRAERSRFLLETRLLVSPISGAKGGVLQATSDSDSFSVVSDPQQGTTSTGVDQISGLNHPNDSEDDLSEEFLIHLVERYTNVCYERRMVQEEIEDRLEKKKRIVAEKLRCAKIALETTRQKAVNIVAALNDASQGDSKVSLPTGSIQSVGHNPIFTVPDGVYATGSGPMALPSSAAPVAGPYPVKPCAHSSPIASSKQTPLPPSASATPALDTIRSTPLNHPTQSASRHTPVAQNSPIPLQSQAPKITPTQRAIYKKYEQMMVTAKAAGGAVSMLTVPWPTLTSQPDQYPMQNIMAQQLEDSSVTCFIKGYIQWKGWNLKDNGASVLADWEQLHSQVPGRKPGGKACLYKVVLILRKLMRG